MFISWMLIMPSFTKSLIVEQFQGNYLNFIEGLRMSSLKEIRELLVDFYNYDGVISYEKFVLLYDEI